MDVNDLQRGDFVEWSEARPMQEALEKSGMFLSIDNHGCALVQQPDGKIREIMPSQLRHAESQALPPAQLKRLNSIEAQLPPNDHASDARWLCDLVRSLCRELELERSVSGEKIATLQSANEKLAHLLTSRQAPMDIGEEAD